MGTSEAVLQVLHGARPQSFSRPRFSNPNLAFLSKFHTKCVNKRASRYVQIFKCSSILQNHLGIHGFKDGSLFEKTAINRLKHMSCKCQQGEGVSDIITEHGNETWFIDSAKILNLNSAANTQNVLELEDVQQLKREKEELASNGAVKKEKESLITNGAVGTGGDTSCKVSIDSIEDEAWNLLRDSLVFYCGSPIGTIAANDPTSSNVLNYDQVFIRDFIPSGIAFLLKGEYDIVRNFILHTLQLQSWEKTMDCHSPGQGLMPASFKVRTVPLDGDESATEEVLDPDFGEAAIGRVAPVDSGLWWIILLRAYGKCSGDLSVQERIDVQTGIKMILRLCLADGFDMFPTLLVTDGSCMIDRRMGIHGHPLEIQLTVACIKMNRPEIAARAVEIAEKRISLDKWPEYYDTKKARLIGKQARLFQTWSIAGYLVAKLLLADPSTARIFITHEDSELINAFSCMISTNPRRKRGRKNMKQTYIV